MTNKNIRQRLSDVFRTTFRSSPNKSKIRSSCYSVKKPDDYEYVPYQQKQRSTNNDYIDLRECYSLLHSEDSGISIDSNESTHPLQSTKIHSDDSSISTLPNISYISHLDINTKQSTFQCCRCQCHHHINNHFYLPNNNQQKQIKTKLYPFIF